MKQGIQGKIRTAMLAILGVATLSSARPYIVGVDITWLLEDESVGATYYDGATKKDLFVILKDHGVNFIRVRTFVNSCVGYAKESYSGADPNVCWCDLDHTITLAKRIKAAKMGFLLDFHMSDTWASIGKQYVPAAWKGMTAAQMQTAAHDYVKTNVKTLVDLGLRPDMVQVGNEISSAMSGVSSSKPEWAQLINAGIKGVREIDPSIKIVMQHGQPRPDKNFMDWYGKLKAGKVDYDIIGGSTYGTTNNGDDWRQMFGNVVKDGSPVVSLEYTSERTTLINTVMSEMPNQMGLGSFVWEPTRYDKPMFDRSGNKYTANAKLDELQGIAKKYNATLPDFVKLGSKPVGIQERVVQQVPLVSFDRSSNVVSIASPMAHLRLFSTRGELVVDTRLESGAASQSFVLPVGVLRSGVYLLEVRSATDRFSSPITLVSR